MGNREINSKTKALVKIDNFNQVNHVKKGCQFPYALPSLLQ